MKVLEALGVVKIPPTLICVERSLAMYFLIRPKLTFILIVLKSLTNIFLLFVEFLVMRSIMEFLGPYALVVLAPLCLKLQALVRLKTHTPSGGHFIVSCLVIFQTSIIEICRIVLHIKYEARLRCENLGQLDISINAFNEHRLFLGGLGRSASIF
jgi:hypothetical protein